MAFTVSQGDLMEYSIRYELHGQTCLNVFHYRLKASTPSVLDGVTAFEDFLDTQLGAADSIIAKIKAASSSELLFREHRMQVIYPIRSIFVAKSLVISGSVAQDAHPVGVAVCVTKRPGIAGKSITGRVECPGVPVTSTLTGSLNSTGIGLYSAVASALTLPRGLDTGVNTLEPVIFRRGFPLNSKVVESAIVQTALRYMTRRTVGRGI